MGKSSKKTRRPYGSGSIRDLGGGRWLVEACGGRRSDGRPRRTSTVVHGTKADAELALVKLRTEMGLRPNMGDEMTLDEYYEGVFVPTRSRFLAKRTMETYDEVYRNHIKPVFGPWRACDIGRGDVQRWALALPTAAIADKAFRHLRAILRAMWDEELLDEKPLDRRVRLPRHQVAPNDIWTPEELSEALWRLRGTQLEAIALVMGGGGLRREEALALDLPDDLSFAEVTGMDGTERLLCRVVVRKAWADDDGQRDSTKTYVARPVTIGDPFSRPLRDAVSDGRPKLVMKVRGKGPLSPASVPETWSRAFGEKGPLHGMRFVELRTLRHTHETMVASQGVSDAHNAKLHGHSTRVMYSHYLTVASDDADRIADAVREAMGFGIVRNPGGSKGRQGGPSATGEDGKRQVDGGGTSARAV